MSVPVGMVGEGAIVALPLVFFAVTIWRLERQRRNGGSNDLLILGYEHFCKQLAPEIIASLLVGALVFTTLALGVNQSLAPPEDGEALWSDIKNTWPVLMTADTLLALQAIMRLMVFVSAAARRAEFTSSALNGEASALLLVASLSRCALQGLSPSGVYTLDGPLGGHIYTGVEALCCALLVYLSRGMLQKGPRAFAGIVALTAVAVTMAVLNHHAVADPSMRYLDMLFSLGHIADLFAAGAFLMKTVLEAGACKKDAFSMFAHLLLPIQQLLATYFLLTWLDGPFVVVRELVGAGHPFELLQLCSIIQVGIYVISSVTHLAAVTTDDKLLQQNSSWEQSTGIEMPQHEPLVVGV